ncbi:bZIP transcription factor [Haloarculaceae archaeon H-GB2-1]|nr:bZIP transcription factor [Haloarculaceae archaeon H-GB1-1]MEA5387653.1 bZIP transcription factor [Haloarculaceae archaeon H-GB11]MEA5409140.1 bZIP transcription factor [Haloarculaceae archaeon H-GB2-1]
MSPNRVEKLEERVKELEASVEGLTDELVECKVRIRELENAIDEDLGVSAESDAETPKSPAETSADTPKAEGSDEGDNTESESSDIIVA